MLRGFRRHLTTSQRAALAAEVAKMPVGTNQYTEGGQNWLSTDKASKAFNVSTGNIKKAKKIQEESPELFEEVKAGKKTLEE